MKKVKIGVLGGYRGTSMINYCKCVGNAEVVAICDKAPDVKDAIRFLREREIVHFQRFGEALRTVQEHLDSKNIYAFNPAYDKK